MCSMLLSVVRFARLAVFVGQLSDSWALSKLMLIA